MDEGRTESGGRLTTTIPRPTARRASDLGRSRLGDIRRRRVRRADRITPRRRSAWLFGLAALVVAGSIGAALFGLPVRTWFEQDQQLQGLEHELSELQTVNNDLESEVDRLQTDDGIVEAAREELGHVQAGDNRQTMLALPSLPRDLPDGWPYSQVDSILAIREAAEAAEAAGVDPADTVAPAPGGWIDLAPPTSAAPAAATPSPALTATTVVGSPGPTVSPTSSPTPPSGPPNS